MTATDPRPELAAMPAARLAPAAEALAASYKQDMSAGPPPHSCHPRAPTTPAPLPPPRKRGPSFGSGGRCRRSIPFFVGCGGIASPGWAPARRLG